MGKTESSTHRERALHRQSLRARTIAVSFTAAVSSARGDVAMGPAERDALIESWRAWSLRVLAHYGDEIEAMRSGPDRATDLELAGIRAELADAMDAVRNG